MNSRQRRKLRRFSERMYVSARTQQTTAWLDERPWIDVTGDRVVPPYMLLEKAPPPNGHDLGKVFESVFKSLESSQVVKD